MILSLCFMLFSVNKKAFSLKALILRYCGKKTSYAIPVVPATFPSLYRLE